MYKKIVIDKKEVEALRNTDDKMRSIIDIIGDVDRDYIPDPFVALINSIVFQQLAYKAAITIWKRFEDLVQEVSPNNILKMSNESLRGCGLSRPKISYIKNISDAVISGELNLTNIHQINDEEIIRQLTRIKGIGEWTAEMFLIFSLNRKNILSFKDLSIRKGLQWLHKLEKEPTKEEFQWFKDKYSPSNTLVSFYLWEITIKNYFQYDDIEDLKRKQGFF